MRWKRAWQGKGGAAASEGCTRQGEGGREERRRGGEWSGAGEMSRNGLAQVRVRVRVRVRERMGGSLGENERVREWV